MSRRARGLVGGALAFAVLTLVVTTGRAQHQGHGTAAPAATPADAGSRKITTEELHQSGGVPRGWKFALPSGDPAKGRELFAELECFKCHAIQGESFPQGTAAPDAKNVGPALTGMGGLHPAEYFAESILSPNAVIIDGPGFTGPDGKSIMPSYADSLSVVQLVDLVAFLKSLTSGGGHPHGAAAAVKSEGDYTVRLEYRVGDQGLGDHTGHAGHGAPAAAAPGHLMVFVSDRVSGEPVPYLPVTATIRAAGAPARVVKLSPMVGRQGFHYGGNVVLPAVAHTITLVIRPATMPVMDSARGRFAKPVTVVFERSPVFER